MTARRLLAVVGSVLLGALGLVAGATPALAANVACGQTILVSTVLNGNVGPCASGITIGADNVTLDLAGFTVTGSGEGSGPGILLEDRTGVTVRNGTVTGFEAGVGVLGGSADTVTGMTVVDNHGSSDYGDGIVVYSSDHDTITRNVVRNNGTYDGIGLIISNFNLVDGNQIVDNNESGQTTGIRLENAGPRASNDNTVTNNLVTGSGLDGVEVFAGGSRNLIRSNQVVGNARDGITVFAGGNNNVIETNSVRSNRANGINVRGAAGNFPAPAGNQILRNSSFGNTQFDLRDGTPNCGTNLWHGNQAVTFTPPCTLNP